jgi:hypothetical protein
MKGGTSKMVINLTNVNYIGIVIASHHYKGVKNPRKIYAFNSRLQLFYSYKEAAKFELEVLNKLNEVDHKNIHQVYYVSSTRSIAPPDDLNAGDRYYCPYCGEVNYLDTNPITGYKLCPICHCSIADYDFKKYNALWHKDSKQANTGKVLKKRRKKKDDKKS